MRTRGRRLLALLGSGLLVAALASCSQAGNGNTSAPGVGGGPGMVTEESPSATPTPAVSVDEVTGGSTAITLDAGFTEALTTLKVTPEPTGDATLKSDVLAFPITGGDVTAYPADAGVDPAITGDLDHDGSGLRLTLGSRTVLLDDLQIQLGAPSRIVGDVHSGDALIAQSAALFDLDVADASASTASGDTVIDGITVTLSEGAAGALNSAFRTDAITAGLSVGTAAVTVTD